MVEAPTIAKRPETQETPNQSLLDTFKQLLQLDEPQLTPKDEEKLYVLEQLVGNETKFIRSLIDHITLHNQDREARKKPPVRERTELQTVLVGKIFELLVETESKRVASWFLHESALLQEQYDYEDNGQRKEAKAKERELEINEAASDLVLDILHNPGKFGMYREFKHLRNPDLAYVKVVREGTTLRLIITEAGEVKLGKLNQRALQQLQGGIKSDLQKAVNALNSLSDSEREAKGMNELIGYHLEMSDEFRQVLILPSNRDTNFGDGNDKSAYDRVYGYVDPNEISPEETVAFRDFCWNNRANFAIKSSRFSIADAHAMTTHILDNFS